jgi:hypothetical protein
MNLKTLPLALLATGALQPAFCETLLWGDNFNVGNSGNLDASDITSNPAGLARRTGIAATAIQLRSGLKQHGVLDGQLNFLSGARVRFHKSGNGSEWYNFAAGAVGEAILAAGGLRVEFDWIAGNNTSGNWVAVDMGIPSSGEPGTRVNHADTDYGILFRFNGGVQAFDNGTVVAGERPAGFAPTTVGTRHVVMDYTFDSFDDDTPVSLVATVDGVVAYTATFTWAGNNGGLYMELETLENTRIDNIRLSTPPFAFEATSNTPFASGLGDGGSVTSFQATLSGGPDETATYELVDGYNAIDNDKFKIVGDELQTNGFDFTNDAHGTRYTVRVKGTGSDGTQTAERVLTFTLFNDDDLDTIQDEFEMDKAGNLTDLNGLGMGPGPGAGTGDFDGDGLTDFEEYERSVEFPGIDPTNEDSDGDGLTDFEELNPEGSRVVTHPGRSDSDRDGLSDLVESNSGVAGGPNDSGTNPMIQDTDGDGARDGFEIERSSDPLDENDVPALPAGFVLKPFASFAELGINASKTYTHKVSGGDSTVVLDGMLFDNLSPAATPPNMTWNSGPAGKGQIIATFGNWIPFEGGVADTETDVRDFLGSFAYAPTPPGTAQTYTLSGLTPGTTYDVRIYIRLWGNDTPRPIDLLYTNGSQIEMPFGALLEDRAGIVLGNGNNHTPYYISFTYVAEGTELTIQAKVPDGAPAASGGFHLYGLTNELVTLPSTLEVTGARRTVSGEFIIDFLGLPETTYQVTKSPDLVTPFVPLTIPLSVTTNVGGVGQAIIPASEASEASEFYRIEE